MYCITGTRKGLVDMPYRFRISPQESWGTYFMCTSYGVRLNFVIASRLIKRYPAMPANVARSLFIHPRDTKTVWHVDQTLPRAGDAIHPVLWKRCGFQTNFILYTTSYSWGISEHHRLLHSHSFHLLCTYIELREGIYIHKHGLHLHFTWLAPRPEGAVPVAKSAPRSSLLGEKSTEVL